MEGDDNNAVETFMIGFREKAYNFQNDSAQSYIIDDEGNLIEYVPPELCTMTMKTEDDESSNDSEMEQNSAGVSNKIEGQQFELNLMADCNKNLVKNEQDGPCHYLMLYMDIQESLIMLKSRIEQKLHFPLIGYSFYLQGAQRLQVHKNLVNQCVQGEGLVQISIEVQIENKRINIIDVLKPAEDYVEDGKEIETNEQYKTNETRESKNIVQWQVDLNFKYLQEKLKMPNDPLHWQPVHVRHWIQWAVRQFNLPNLKLSDWSLTGKQLLSLTIEEFRKIVPNDPLDIFWIHLELLRKMKVVAIIKEDVNEPGVIEDADAMSTEKFGGNHRIKSSISDQKLDLLASNMMKAPHNGHIHLWQFLLELLMSKEYSSIIHWIGNDGEFKLFDPELVARLWGERKNKPKMNYEKLSRALRYYYDSDMITKVHGKRFVYKFVCDLKKILGHTPVGASNMCALNSTKVSV